MSNLVESPSLDRVVLPQRRRAAHESSGAPRPADVAAARPVGTEAAERRHMLVERLLSDVIGMEWSQVHLEARRIEDSVSEELESKIVELLSDPGTCPHGIAIPGSSNAPAPVATLALSDAPEGAYEVVRIDEELEEDLEALRMLQASGATPGQLAEVASRGSDSVVLIGARSDAVVPLGVAAMIRVAAR